MLDLLPVVEVNENNATALAEAADILMEQARLAGGEPMAQAVLMVAIRDQLTHPLGLAHGVDAVLSTLFAMVNAAAHLPMREHSTH